MQRRLANPAITPDELRDAVDWALASRRSICVFLPRAVARADIEAIIDVARYSASGMNKWLVLCLGHHGRRRHPCLPAQGDITCAWQAQWSAAPADRQARLKARQGVRAAMLEQVRVAPEGSVDPVACDAALPGEILLRGNTVMMGYLKNPNATAAAFLDGWFHTGHVAVVHPDGYLQITGRSKDIIISGGENISSVEVEEVLYTLPGVLYVAVVAQPDDKWGEVPRAFVEMKAGADGVTAGDVIAFCRQRLAHFKCPRRVIFCEVPKTATGKIQKFKLRQQAGSREAITRIAI